MKLEQLRAISQVPKTFGDFGEALVAYALTRKGFRISCANHVGANLIAEGGPHRIAVFVKTRVYKKGTHETRGLVIEHAYVEKLEEFKNLSGLETVFAHVVRIEDDNVIHLFMLRVADIKQHLKEVKHGFRLRFSPIHINGTIASSFVDYSSWSDESIGCKLFNTPSR